MVERGGCEAVFVAGEAGTGKSRLAEWMTTRADEVGAARIVRAVHTPEGAAIEGLRGALERTLRTLKMDRGEVYEHLLETVRAARRDDDGLVDQDARALTEYLRPTDEGADTIDGPRFRFANARQKRAVLVRTLGRLADQRPLVLWLDDLQWGPEAVGVLEYLQERRSDPSEMLILATVRSDVVAERPRLAERLEPLREMDGATSLELEPLSREYQRELLDGLLPLEDDLADRLAERTEGHPLFAMQLLGHWIERRDLRVGAKGFGMAEGRELELPADIHQIWIERIDRLRERFDRKADQVLEVLELAAALGRQINLEEWVGLLADADLPRPAGLVDRLVERGLAERTADGWAFAHGLLVDSLARRSRESGRWKGHHRRCARLLEARLTGEETGPRERIAEHWVAGGRAERALEPLLEESELCLRRGNATKHRSVLERCGELLERLEIADDDPRRLEHQIRRAHIMLARDADAAGELLERVQQEAAAAGYLVIEAVTLNDLGEEARFGGRYSEARRYYRQYLTLVRQLSRPVLELLGRLNLGQIALRTGALDRSADHLKEAEDLLEAVGARDRRDIVHLLHLGQAAGTEDRSTFAERWEPLADGWPEDWRLIDDHPWLLETIGEYAEEAGWAEEAREVWRLGAELREELGDEEAAERLRGRVER